MNWKSMFDYRILDRGYDYYANDFIEEMELYPNKIVAKVIGNEVYDVEIELKNDSIESMYCSCPYAEDGKHCKHMAAVLFAYTKEDEEYASYDDEEDWEDEYEDHDDYEYYYTADSSVFEMIRNTQNIESMKLLLEKILSVKPELDYLYKNILSVKDPQLSTVIYTKRIDEILREKDHEHALSKVFDELVSKFIEYSMFDEGFQFIKYVIDQCDRREMLNVNDQETISHYFKKMQDVVSYEKQCDWLKEIFFAINYHSTYPHKNFIYLVATNYKDDVFVDKIIGLITHECKNINQMISVHEQKMRIKQIQNFLDGLAYYGYDWSILCRCCRNNIEYPWIRTWYIEKNIEKESYKEALNYAEYPLSLNNTFFLKEELAVKKQLYTLLGDAEKLKEVLQVLFESLPSLENYKELKACFSFDEWEAKKETVISTIKNFDLLLEVYREENQWRKLFDQLENEQNLTLLMSYDKYFPNTYSEKILKLYQRELENWATVPANRQIYAEWAKVLLRMCEIRNGIYYVEKIIATWKSKYANRRAMWDELRVVLNRL